MTRRVPSVAEVRAAYRPKFAHELRTEWAIALVYRPVSFMLTPLFAACGASPGMVTLLGLAIALSLPWLALDLGTGAWAWVGVLGLVFCVLDCVDGDLARATGRASPWGAYSDFVSDTLYRIALYASIGLMVDAAAGHAGESARVLGVAGERAGLAAGLLCALLAIAARACRLFIEAGARGVHERLAPAQSGAGNVTVAFLSGIDHLLPVGVLAFGAAGRLEWLLAWLLAYSLGDLLLTQYVAWNRLR